MGTEHRFESATATSRYRLGKAHGRQQKCLLGADIGQQVHCTGAGPPRSIASEPRSAIEPRQHSVIGRISHRWIGGKPCVYFIRRRADQHRFAVQTVRDCVEHLRLGHRRWHHRHEHRHRLCEARTGARQFSLGGNESWHRHGLQPRERTSRLWIDVKQPKKLIATLRRHGGSVGATAVAAALHNDAMEQAARLGQHGQPTDRRRAGRLAHHGDPARITTEGRDELAHPGQCRDHVERAGFRIDDPGTMQPAECAEAVVHADEYDVTLARELGAVIPIERAGT